MWIKEIIVRVDNTIVNKNIVKFSVDKCKNTFKKLVSE